MNTSTQKLFGMVAVALAVLFPIYWIHALSSAVGYADVAHRQDFATLDGWDLLFLIIGLLEVAVYLGLWRYFRDQLNGGFIGALLLVMAVLVGLTHATLLIDLLHFVGALHASDALLDMVGVASLVLLGLYAVVLFALALTLLVRFVELPNLLRIFAVLALITAGLQITIVFAVANIVLFPILMLVLAMHFFSGDDSVEVV